MTVTSCQEVVRVTVVMADPTSVVPFWYSRSFSLSVVPATSARTQMLAVYVPAMVVATQLGASLRMQAVPAGPLFVSSADQFPECPPATRVRLTTAARLLVVFHPEVLVSKPGLPTRLTFTLTDALAVEARPAVSVTVTVTV